MRMYFHKGEEEGEDSQFRRQVSDQECAKSIRRMRPMRMKSVAPGRETYVE